MQEANQYVEAGHMKQKISHNLAKDPFEKASEIFVRTGRFNQAAKLVKVSYSDPEHETL